MYIVLILEVKLTGTIETYIKEEHYIGIQIRIDLNTYIIFLYHSSH
jgi:hypothetical protein